MTDKVLTVEEQAARGGNFIDEGKLYLVRCYQCEGDYGRENWAQAGAGGTCAHCGWGESK